MQPEKRLPKEKMRLSKVEAHNLVERIRQRLQTGIPENRRRIPPWDDYADKFRMGEPFTPDQS